MPSESTAPAYAFTVFTSTRNRAHTLQRVYGSLKAQTFRDFEWLVIDNGSTDGTSELIARYGSEADFPIRYYWQDDAGKHGSQNRAVDLAQGELFVILDSDDGCIPTTLERLKYHWESIPAERRSRFSGVTGLCKDEHGRLVGTPFPNDPTDSDNREIRYRYKVTGEKWGCLRTDVLREYPLPEVPGYRGVVPPTIVWSAIARSYKTRFVNEALHIYWQDQPVSLSRASGSAEDAYGGMLENKLTINHDLEFFVDSPLAFVMAAVNYARWSFHLRTGLRSQWRNLADARARALFAATVAAGWLAYLLDTRGLSHYARRVRRLLVDRATRGSVASSRPPAGSFPPDSDSL